MRKSISGVSTTRVRFWYASPRNLVAPGNTDHVSQLEQLKKEHKLEMQQDNKNEILEKIQSVLCNLIFGHNCHQEVSPGESEKDD